MGVSTNIKALRADRNWTQEQLADRLGVTRSTVTQWETGWSQPRMGALKKLATTFDVTIAEIVSDGLPKNALPVAGADMVAVPLRGRVHAGSATEPENLNELGKTVLIPRSLLDADPETYACESEGDCMDRVYPEGCTIVVSPNRQPQNGSVAVVTIDGHDAVMRRMYRTQNTLVLSPDSHNPEHTDIVITSDSDHTVEFGGKVVWFQAREEME